MGDYQAPDSPIMIEVTKTVCIDGRIANDFGVCVCPGMSVESVIPAPESSHSHLPIASAGPPQWTAHLFCYIAHWCLVISHD